MNSCPWLGIRQPKYLSSAHGDFEKKKPPDLRSGPKRMSRFENRNVNLKQEKKTKGWVILTYHVRCFSIYNREMSNTYTCIYHI